MDKKNTMLLTVIAVATLLVAVVGATFAYFTATGTNSSSTATVTATTAKLGAVALTGSTSAKIDLSATEMSQTAATATYYAVASTETAGYSTTATDLEAFTVASAGGEDDAVYYCTFTLTTSATGLNENVIAADGEVTFTTPTVSGITITGMPTSYTLADLYAGSKTDTINLTITGNVSIKPTFNATIVNTDAAQDYLAGLNATITIAGSDFSCDTSK